MSRWLDMQDPTRAQRRLGDRVPVAAGTATIVAEVGRWRRRNVRHSVTIDNVSVTGVGLVGRLPPEILSGELVLDIHGVLTAVRLRQSSPGSDGATSYYGFEFVRPDPQIHREINKLIHVSTADHEARWHSWRVR